MFGVFTAYKMAGGSSHITVIPDSGLSEPESKASPLVSSDPIGISQKDEISREKLKGTTILHVEDIPLNRRCTKKAVQKNQWIYKKAPSGEAALRIFEKGKYDVVLMDIELGEDKMDGYATARRIRETDLQQLIFSCSSKPVEDEVYEKQPLFNGHLGKRLTKEHLWKNLSPVLLDKENRPENYE